jgi:hypothetical protein
MVRPPLLRSQRTRVQFQSVTPLASESEWWFLRPLGLGSGCIGNFWLAVTPLPLLVTRAARASGQQRLAGTTVRRVSGSGWPARTENALELITPVPGSSHLVVPVLDFFLNVDLDPSLPLELEIGESVCER